MAFPVPSAPKVVEVPHLRSDVGGRGGSESGRERGGSGEGARVGAGRERGGSESGSREGAGSERGGSESGSREGAGRERGGMVEGSAIPSRHIHSVQLGDDVGVIGCLSLRLRSAPCDEARQHRASWRRGCLISLMVCIHT
jgi:hypothetical protein